MSKAEEKAKMKEENIKESLKDIFLEELKKSEERLTDKK